MHQKLTISIVALLAVCLVIAGWLMYLRIGIHKLRMPATYDVQLPAGVYGLWYFWQWPSKGLRSAPHEISVTIIDESGRQVKPLPWPPTPSQYPPDKYGSHTGREEFQFKLLQSGKFKFHSKDACVFVIVPAAKYYDSVFGRAEFEGIYDDFNFDSPD